MIVLVGFMGAGKSSVGALLAARCGLPFIDSDRVIEDISGRTVREIFALQGESAFRELESSTIRHVVTGPDAVVALGGGASTDPRTRAALAGLPVVYLQVGYEQAMARVRGDEGRPLLADPRLESVYRERLPLYASIASLTVSTDDRSTEVIVAEVMSRLGLEPAATSTT